MEQIIDTPENQKPASYGGFGVRFVAYLIDCILLSILQWILMGIFGIKSFMSLIALSKSGGEPDPEMVAGFVGNMMMVAGISFLIVIFYFCGFESSSKQGTIGKQAMRLKVGDANGNRIGFINALGRYFAKILSSLILCIGYLMIIWDNKKQGLHDRIAGTYVYRS